jgi:hypothetical protein
VTEDRYPIRACGIDSGSGRGKNRKLPERRLGGPHPDVTVAIDIDHIHRVPINGVERVAVTCALIIHTVGNTFRDSF